MKISKKFVGIVSAALISSLFAFPAMAAEAIESIKLEVTSYIKEGDTTSNITVRSLSDTCVVSSTSIENEPDDEWEEGDTPKIKVILKADGDDYKFTSALSKSDITIKGNDATVTKISRSGSTKLTVSITLDEIDDSSSVTAAQPIGGMTGGIGAQQPPQPQATTTTQGWQQDSRGWKWGSLANQWKQIDNKWYYFDENGYMVTGWKQIGGKWYYLNEDGEMLHDTITPDGYRVGPDGAMIN